MVERQRHGLAHGCLRQITTMGDDAFDHCRTPRIRHSDGVARTYGARHHRACIPAEVVFSADDVLDWESEANRINRGNGLPLLKEAQETRAGIPRHVIGRGCDVLAVHRRDRNGHHLRHLKSLGRG